ncbi:MAG: histidine--tRNA ligase [Nitrospinaceae bacterium]
MKIKSIRGVKDILPGEIEKWQGVESTARSVFSRYGFREIRIPIFESTRLFARSIGETTDIVEKEMYTFQDRSGDSITLRPEGTASVVRAFIEHRMYGPGQVSKLYYMGPMFRYERPQAGRFRQFYQIGVEAMGTSSPAMDAETISMLMLFYHELGLQDLTLHINSLGSSASRDAYREVLKDAIRPHLETLCPNCNARYERNPLRVLDCKVDACVKIAGGLPRIQDHLIEEDKDHFHQVQAALNSIGTDYQVNDRLVRGLDYYSRTTFEVTAGGLGSQNAVCGGGRYDGLVEEFGGPATPCFGFAMGMERLITILPDPEAAAAGPGADVFLVLLGEAARNLGFSLIHRLRRQGFRVERDYEGGSMKSQMRKANKSGAKYAVLLGDNEIQSGRCPVKEMETGTQVEAPVDSLESALQIHRED